MIDVNIREHNLLVTLLTPGKYPIRARSGSPYFYNSMELLCIALGACLGGELVKFCSQNKINPAVFESIQITMEDFVPIVTIRHPKEFNIELLNDIKHCVTNCQVSNLLKTEPLINFVENTLPIEELVDETKKTRCCGN